MLISARDKDITLDLLKLHCIPFFPRGKGLYSTFGRIWYLIKTDLYLINKVKLFDPDICVGMSSPYLAHVAAYLRKPVIIYEDTEAAIWVHKLFLPFADTILTPKCFRKNLNNRQLKISSFKELAYLHPKQFLPETIKLHTKSSKNGKLTFVRFISRVNNHDKGIGGLSDKLKTEIIKTLIGYSDVIISTEKGLPVLFPELELNQNIEKVHSILASADLYVGESATMAAEAAILGVPAIYLDNKSTGYIDELSLNYHMIKTFSTSKYSVELALLKAAEMIQSNEKEKCKLYHNKLLSENIDFTAFLVWFIENYPVSVRIMQKDSDYQYRFK